MNPITSVKFLVFLLLSFKSREVNCWDAPSTSVPSPLIGVKQAIPGVVSGDEGGVQGEDRGHVLETHHTTCQITTEELVATAQATATRVLTGLCNSREMEERFKTIEAQIADLLNVLKLMLTNLDNKITSQNDVLRARSRRVQSHLKTGDEGYGCTGPQCFGISSEDFRGYHEETIRKSEEGNRADDSEEITGAFGEADMPREEEISRLNNTVHMEPFPDAPMKNAATVLYRVFTYYWRVRGIATKMNSWDPRRSLRSPSFYVTPNGYRMYLLVFPRQNYENFYVHVGITVGVNDASLAWPFSLKHRIQLLDQVRQPSANRKRPLIPTRQETPQDLASRVWNPAMLCSAFVWRRPLSGDSTECVGLGYPHEVLKSRHYIHDDSVVIKLTVYLA